VRVEIGNVDCCSGVKIKEGNEGLWGRAGIMIQRGNSWWAGSEEGGRPRGRQRRALKRMCAKCHAQLMLLITAGENRSRRKRITRSGSGVRIVSRCAFTQRTPAIHWRKIAQFQLILSHVSDNLDMFVEERQIPVHNYMSLSQRAVSAIVRFRTR